MPIRLDTVQRAVLACILILAVAAFTFLMSLLGGCAAGPDYVRPAVQTPAAYREAAKNGGKDWKQARPADLGGRGDWWACYDDPTLDSLVARVAVSNQNVRQVEARYRQAKALVREARASYFPTVTADGSATRGKQSPGSATATTYAVSGDVSWELDLWGATRRSVESESAGAEASAADLAAELLSMQAELVTDYFALRTIDLELDLYKRTVAAYERSLSITRNQYNAGIVTRSDVASAETQLKSAQASAIDLEVDRRQYEHAIAVLMGQPPATFSLPPRLDALRVPDIPVGVPSELLERRPDIAAAERRAAAANAQIGVAMAAFFPTLTLSAGGGYQNDGLADLLSVPNRVWTLGPELALTLFDGGLRAAKTDYARAAYDETVAGYRQTVLDGFREVEDYLAALSVLAREQVVQNEAVSAAREAERLALDQYKAGTVDYVSVVSAQTQALSSELTSVGLQGRRIAASVSLIEALGGGWRAGGTKAPTANAGGNEADASAGKTAKDAAVASRTTADAKTVE
ncbi:RND efflux system, outer membrane lipoprotein, NodT family [Desulfovibrio sp. X2]|uniref:efflux transporter outer membrane subunit n=1 Tax=Desulfovibrio sp. X2 TaxID=941449 RepID=UPI000358D00C|nr:efflux transporter outer membrane subunit [Desulfovibrio sp. X2]EPR37644.1 RND efflux system, outer membrane lipoprotein, NodT family [Desulfovibrio sp. X2]